MDFKTGQFANLGLYIQISILALTSKNSTWRLAALPLLLVWAYNFMPMAQGPDMTLSMINGFVPTMNILQYIEIALLNRWAFEEQGPTSSAGGLQPVNSSSTEAKAPPKAPLWSRIRFALRILLDNRFALTEWRVKNIPNFKHNDPNYVPSKRAFLTTSCVRMVVYFLAIDVLTTAKDSSLCPYSMDFSKTHIFSRLDEVTKEELTMRFLSFLVWWTYVYLFLQLPYCLLSIISVLTGLTEVSAWRPMFGRMRDAWSLRQFWGVYWHQSFRGTLSSPAHFITYKLLRLRKGTLVARYLFILLTFTASALLHIGCDLGMGLMLSQSGAFNHYCLQAVGIMLEDFVQWAFPSSSAAKSGGPTFARRVMGMLWVVAWLTWTTPAWMYPMMARYGTRERPLSLSLIENL